MLHDALSDFGYHVLGPVENLEAAIYLAATEKIDAAVVDPNFDGQTADAIADKLFERGIPFVFVDGHSRVFSHNNCEIPPLQKPLTTDKLQRAITRLLQQPAYSKIQNHGF
jgi:two-component SAPR family response regulator